MKLRMILALSGVQRSLRVVFDLPGKLDELFAVLPKWVEVSFTVLGFLVLSMLILSQI